MQEGRTGVIETVVTVRSHCRSCGSRRVRKTAVQESTDRWGFVVCTCDDCENSRGSYSVKRKPRWVT